MRALLQQQARLFERAAARLQQQHAKTEELRGRAKAALGRDVCAEARSRKAAVRDKHRPRLRWLGRGH